MSSVKPKVDVYPHNSYTVTEANSSRKHEDQSPAEKLRRMKKRFDEFGVIRSVEAVVLVHAHDHPHVLLLEMNIGTMSVFRLPGGKCKINEDEVDCLKRKLGKKLFNGVEGSLPFRVGEVLSTWIRPNFDPLMYPYRPVHIQKEKEVRVVYLVHLENDVSLSVPKDYRLVAIPLFDLFDNASKYGNVIAGVPHAVSRLHVNLC